MSEKSCNNISEYFAALLEGITEEGSEAVPELLVVPPPPTKVLSNRSSLPLGPPPEKPERPTSVNLSHFHAPFPRVEGEDVNASVSFAT